MKPQLLFYFFILFFASCSNQPEAASDVLDDSLYKYIDLKNTVVLLEDFQDYKRLDSLQKRQILPDITGEIRQMDKDFPYSSMFDAYFVAKQKKIGSIQPVILELFADDFIATILITLNEKNEPLDYTFIDGEEYCGGGHESYCEKYRHSILNEKEIISYDLFRTTSTNNDLTEYTDSVVYKSIINADGSITTIKTDSVRVNLK